MTRVTVTVQSVSMWDMMGKGGKVTVAALCIIGLCIGFYLMLSPSKPPQDTFGPPAPTVATTSVVVPDGYTALLVSDTLQGAIFANTKRGWVRIR